MRTEQLSSGVDEPRVQLSGGLVGPDRHSRPSEHGSGVETGFDSHQVDTGLEVTGEDCTLDRRGAAPARQQREMHIHEAVRQGFEQRDRQQLSERHHDADLRLGRAHFVDDVAGPLRRAHGQAEVERGPLDGRSVDARAARSPAIGLGDHEGDVVTVGDQRTQG